jgi:hypothetical protein
MNPATLTDARPIQGPAFDKSNPESKQAWLDFRRPGITATMIRDWGNASRKRIIIEEKITGDFVDLSHVAAINHGNIREPIIQQWVHEKFGIVPSDNVYAHPENPRHLATPDGVSLDPFTGELVVGEDAVLLEIKTSVHDLNPGRVDIAHMLISIQPGCDFDRMNYYTQIQWQMYVMNAAMTLFVYERRQENADPESGQYVPAGPPQWVWIPRDQGLIDALVQNVAPKALAEIDAAVLAATLGLEAPPESAVDFEEAMLLAEYFAALDDEKDAAARKSAAWKALQDRYTGEGKPDVSIDAGFARVTVTTITGEKRTVDEEGMYAKARTTVERYEALRERFTTVEPTSGQKLTLTRPKPKNVPASR